MSNKNNIKLALVYDACNGSDPQVLDILELECVDKDEHRDQYKITLPLEQAKQLPLGADGIPI